MTMTSPLKTVMLGLDAGDLAFIQTHRDSLPAFRRLLETSQLRSLKTTSELLTGSVWPTFYTGTLPGEHGVYHHLQWDPIHMKIRRVAEDWLYCEPFWYELARQGVKVTVADVPMTFPTRLETGTEVVNWGSHDQLGPFHCNHPATADSIRRHFGAHPMGPEIPVTKSGTQFGQIHQHLVAGAQKKGELIQWLLRTTDWDFFLAVFGETHRGGHILWPENLPDSVIPANALLEVYQAVDRALDGILAQVDFKTMNLIVFSLHGMQANQSQEHFAAAVMERINAAFYQQEGLADSDIASQRSLMRWLRNTVPARLQHAIAEAVPVAVRDWVVSHAVSDGYDWPRTPAFPLLADYNGYLRLNIEGREAKGCIRRKTSFFQRYTDFVKNRLMELQIHDTGQPLVQDVAAAQAVFRGRRSHLLPDFVVSWTPATPALRIGSNRLGQMTAKLETGRSGNHRHEGFMLVSGAESEAWSDAKHIADLAPTLLRHYLSALSRA